MHVSFSPIIIAPGSLTQRVVDAEAGDVDSALRLASELVDNISETPGSETGDLWEALATAAATDLGAARAMEPQLDAAGIMAEAGVEASAGSWGVFAAEGGDDPLIAHATADGWTVTGTKPWCSLAQRLDHALVTATDQEGGRRLFAVALRHPDVHPERFQWGARGLTEIPSGPVRFDGVPGIAVGEAGWYLSRAGFAWGGIQVAACWFGGAVGIGRTVHAAAVRRANPFLLAHLGAIDELLESSRRALAEAVSLRQGHDVVDVRLLSKRVRATVATACEEVIVRAGRALGPAPLALDAEHAKRVADLQLYIRQHHAERDQASLGETLVGQASPW